MKDLEYYMSVNYRMEVVPDAEEGGYVISFPELPGCMTCGDTIDEAVKNASDCKRAWLVAQLEDGADIPEPSRLEDYSGQFKLRLPRTLHKELAERSRLESTSMNQYCVYLLSKALAQK